jgi:hypothetical protein
VHKDTVALAAAGLRRHVREHGKMPSTPAASRRGLQAIPAELYAAINGATRTQAMLLVVLLIAGGTVKG